MNHEIHLTRQHYALLRKHLFQGKTEQVAFGFAASARDSCIHQIEDLYFVQPDEFSYQSAYHVELNEDVHARVIKVAHTRERGLVEFHSHLSSRVAEFSLSDISGFAEFVPHVMWRLPNRAYAAFVFHRRSIDGLLWGPGEKQPVPINLVVDGRVIASSGRTIRYSNMDNDEYAL